MRVLAALVVPILLAFLAIKLAPSHHHHGNPPIVIRSEGSDQRLTRSVLTSALEKLFPKGNGTWKLQNATYDPSAACARRSPGYLNATGRAVTAGYVFAGWLGVRLADYVYPNAADAAAARSTPPQSKARGAVVCEAHVIAELLRRAKYEVGAPHIFPVTSVDSEGGRSVRVVLPARYRGHRRDWDYDSTSLRRGRLVLVVLTATAKPFQQMNKAFARELLPGHV